MIMEYGIIASTGLENVNADFIKSLLLVAIVGLQIYALFRKPAGVPNPLQIEKLDKFATRDWCEMLNAQSSRRLDAHDAEFRAIHEEMKRDRQVNQEHASKRGETLYRKIDEVQAEFRTDVAGVHDRINEVLGEVRELKGRVEEKL